MPVVGREALEQRVGVGGVANGERPDVELLADAVEDDDAAGAVHGDEAGELVGELAHVGVPTGVEQVVAVKEVEGRVRHGVIVG